jgi:hypothetical protein
MPRQRGRRKSSSSTSATASGGGTGSVKAKVKKENDDINSNSNHININTNTNDDDINDVAANTIDAPATDAPVNTWLVYVRELMEDGQFEEARSLLTRQLSRRVDPKTEWRLLIERAGMYNSSFFFIIVHLLL